MIRGLVRLGLGHSGWREDFELAQSLAISADPVARVILNTYPYGMSILNGALLPDADVIEKIGGALRDWLQQSGDDFTLSMARFVNGILLQRRGGADHALATDLLTMARESTERSGNTFGATPVDVQVAFHQLEAGDIEAAADFSGRCESDGCVLGGVIVS